MTVEVGGFDGTERCRTRLEEPDRYAELFRSLDPPGPCSIRGAGLSYVLASACDGGTAVSTRHFDRILDFDPVARCVKVEAGLTVGALHDFAIGAGCYFPVLPGHPSITVGGCAGFNVHGKTQHDVGHFADHVTAFTLYHPDHGEVRCTETDDGPLFALTLGGMGLTGCIVDVTLRLQPLAGGSVARTAHPVRNLHEAVELMRSLDADALYSWNDLNANGDRFGAGVVYEERFVAGDRPSRVRYRHLRPTIRTTPRLWNAATVRAVNELYPRRDALRPVRISSAHDAAFPINGSEAYYLGFGSAGLREYQMIVPYAAWSEAVRALEIAIAASGAPVTLGSLKLFAGTPRLLWFVDDGVCVTVDGAADERTGALFSRLDAIARDVGARVNVAKDSRLEATTVAALFPEYDDVGAALERFDPKRRFDSALRRRLGL